MAHSDRVASAIDPTLVLTQHRIAILTLLGRGARGPDVAQALGIGIDAVHEQVADLRRRFGARSTAELVRLAIHHGFIDASGPGHATNRE